MTTHEKYKAIKSRLRITDAQVAEWFGYKNPASFANSREGKEKVIAGIVALFDHIGKIQTEFWEVNK